MFQEREQMVAAWVEREEAAGLGACKEVLEYVAGLVEPWSGRPISHDHDGVMGAVLARSIKTFAALPHLIRNGYGEQAAMLNRSLFEDMVDAHWVSVNPALAIERYEQQVKHNAMVMGDRMTKHRDTYPEIDLPGYDEEERKQLDGLFGKHGDKHWTGLSLHARTQAIEACWEDEEGRGHLRWFRDIAQRINNQLLHVSAYSLNQTLQSREDEALAFSLGPTNEHLDDALFFAYWTFIQTGSLMVEFFELDDVAVINQIAARHIPRFRRLSDDELHGVGRNDPCPCESGKKFKKCHGAAA